MVNNPFGFATKAFLFKNPDFNVFQKVQKYMGKPCLAIRLNSK